MKAKSRFLSEVACNFVSRPTNLHILYNIVCIASDITNIIKIRNALILDHFKPRTSLPNPIIGIDKIILSFVIYP